MRLQRQLRPLRSMGLQRFLRHEIITEDFKVILVLEFDNLRTKIIFTESWKFLLNFSTFWFGGCWGQSMFFLKLVDRTQISKLQDHTETFKHNLICISHLSTAVSWREKKFKHFVSNKYFSLVLEVLKSKKSQKSNEPFLRNRDFKLFHYKARVQPVSKITNIATRNRC